jgi:hydroxysqualene dehydroxylase
VLRRSRLPAPLHLASALARYPYVGWRARLGAARAALALGRLSAENPELDRRTLGSWLAARGQGPEAVAALWDLIALPTLNLPAEQASLALGVFVFRTGLLDRADAGDIGFHRRPLGEIVGGPAERALRAVGVDMRLGFRVREVRGSGAGFDVLGGYGDAGDGASAGAADSVSVGAADGASVGAADGASAGAADGASAEAADEDGLHVDAAIVALPHARAAKLLEPLDPATASAAAALGDAPIVNLHAVYDRVVCELPFAAGVGTPVQYVFDRSEAGGVGPGRQYLAISLSGAEREMQMSVDALRERYVPALAALFPRARQAKLELFLATREHAATFRAQPGSAALRGGPGTAVPRLALAGAWTATGGPATLEGATLSGHAAAASVLGEL